MLKLLREDRVVWRIVVIFACAQVLAAAWDLPSSFGWENDGIAPRDLFGGLKFNLTPGEGHRYPLLHYVIVAVGSLPFLLLGVFRASSWEYDAIERQILSIDVMTGVSAVAKLIAIACACVAVLILGRLARRVASIRAGRLCALYAVTCLSFSYYGRTSNLDGPALMWIVLALDRLWAIVEEGKRRDFLLFALSAAAALATKDQAYAAFVLTVPIYLVIRPLLPKDGPATAGHFRNLALGAGAGTLALGVLGGGLLNPTGFVARLGALVGENSQNWRAYESGIAGLAANIGDAALLQAEYFWPWPLVAGAWAGVFLCLLRPDRALAMLPFVAAVSSLVTFTLVVGRAGQRFLLPLGFLLSVYGGVAGDKLCAAAQRIGGVRGRRIAYALLIALLAWAGFRCLTLILTQFGDARRQVETFLAEVPPHARVETYGLLVYQPRFQVDRYRVQHLGSRDIKLPGVEHIRAPYGRVQERAPDFLLVPESYAARYLPRERSRGQAASLQDRRSLSNSDAVAFFRAAVTDTLPGYRVVLRAEPRLPAWARLLGARPIRIHGSTGARLWVLARQNRR